MKYISTTIKFIYSIYGFTTFVVIMFLVLPFVFIAAIFGIKGGNVIYKICALWARLWYIIVGIKHKEIYEAPHNINKQYIFIGNHISYLDIPVVFLSIHQPFRALGKYEMVKIPVFGWIYKVAVIQVDRSDSTKRAKSVRALKAALAKGISVFIFPEGTFNETEKPLKNFYDGAFRIAIETQTDIKPIIFLDTVKRLHYSNFFSLTMGQNRAVYLDEVSVQGLTSKDLTKLKQRVFEMMETALLRYK